METIDISEVFAVDAQTLYDAWLDSEKHTAMTGAPSTASTDVGGAFKSFDGYAHGTNLELEPNRRIVQAWRANDFPADAPDSRLMVTFTARQDGRTHVNLVHSALPPGSGDGYAKGWREFYFVPMRKYFGRQVAKPASTPPPAAAPEMPAEVPAAPVATPTPKPKARTKPKPKVKANATRAKAAAKKKPAVKKKTAAVKKKTVAAKKKAPAKKKAAAKKKAPAKAAAKKTSAKKKPAAKRKK